MNKLLLMVKFPICCLLKLIDYDENWLSKIFSELSKTYLKIIFGRASKLLPPSLGPT